MRRWMRWQTVVPRVLACVVGTMAVYYGATLAVRSHAVQAGTALVGSNVDIANASIELTYGHVHLGGLSVADPRCRDQALLTADHCELKIAAAPLLKKQIVIERARMSGVRFGGSESANRRGIDAGISASSGDPWFGDDGTTAMSQYLANLREHFGRLSIESFESVKRTSELCQRLPDQLSALDGRMQDFLDEAAALEEAIEAADKNRLRHDDTLANLPFRALALQKELDALHAESEKLPAELEKSRRAIVAARRQDEELVRQSPAPPRIDPDGLSQYLLRHAAARSMDDIIAGLRLIRRIIPETPSSRLRPRHGEDVLFAGISPRPRLLIRVLEIDGEMPSAGRPFKFRGRVENLTTTPALVDEPIRIRLSSVGASPVELRATIVRTASGARDEVFVDCRDIPIGDCVLGSADELQLKLAPSTASLSISVALTGDKLCGDVQFVRTDARIIPALGGGFASSMMENSLGESLSQAGAFATRISLEGTLDQPGYKLWSNLGTAVAEALDGAVQQHGEEHARTMLAEARQTMDEELACLEREIAEHQAKFARSTSSMPQRLEAIAKFQSHSERLSAEQPGRRLPDTSLFR